MPMGMRDGYWVYGSQVQSLGMQTNVPRRVRGPGGHQREQEVIGRVEGDSGRVNLGDGIDGGTCAHFPAGFGDGLFSFPWRQDSGTER